MRRILRRKLKLRPDIPVKEIYDILSRELYVTSVNEQLIENLSQLLHLPKESILQRVGGEELYSRVLFANEDSQLSAVYHYDPSTRELDLLILFPDDKADKAMELFIELRALSSEVSPALYHPHYPILTTEGESYEPDDREQSVAEFLSDRRYREMAHQLLEGKLSYGSAEFSDHEEFLRTLEEYNLIKINFVAYCRETRDKIIVGSGVGGLLEIMKGRLRCPFCGRNVRDEEIDMKVIPTLFFSTVLRKKLWFKALIHQFLTEKLPGTQFYLLPPDNDRLVIFYKNLLIITDAFPEKLHLPELQALLREAEFLKSNLVLIFPLEGLSPVAEKFLKERYREDSANLKILTYQSIDEFGDRWEEFKELIDSLVVESIDFDLALRINFRELLKMKVLGDERVVELQEELPAPIETKFTYNDDLELIEMGFLTIPEPERVESLPSEEMQGITQEEVQAELDELSEAVEVAEYQLQDGADETNEVPQEQLFETQPDEAVESVMTEEVASTEEVTSSSSDELSESSSEVSSEPVEMKQVDASQELREDQEKELSFKPSTEDLSSTEVALPKEESEKQLEESAEELTIDLNQELADVALTEEIELKELEEAVEELTSSLGDLDEEIKEAELGSTMETPDISTSTEELSVEPLHLTQEQLSTPEGEVSSSTSEEVEATEEAEELLESLERHEEVVSSDEHESLEVTELDAIEIEREIEALDELVTKEIAAPEMVSYLDIASYVNRVFQKVRSRELFITGELERLDDFTSVLVEPTKRFVLVATERIPERWILAYYSPALMREINEKLKGENVQPLTWLHILEDGTEWLTFSFGSMQFNMMRSSALELTRSLPPDEPDKLMEELLSRDEVLAVTGFLNNGLPAFNYKRDDKGVTRAQMLRYGVAMTRIKQLIDDSFRRLTEEVDWFKVPSSYVFTFQNKIVQLVDLLGKGVGVIWFKSYDTDLLRDSMRTVWKLLET